MEFLMKSELDLFVNKKISSNILKTDEISFKPITSLENQNSNIEFVLNSLSDNYFDLSSVNLRLLVQFQKKDGKFYTSSDDHQPALINYSLNTIFRQVTISMNGKVISSSDGHHGYRSYLETLINMNEESVNTQLKSSGWTDEEENLNDIELNNGIMSRCDSMKNSKIIELYGKIHSDLLNQPLLLLNNVDFRVKFELNKKEFYILSDTKDEDAKLKVLDATLYIKSCQINPKILLSHQILLEKTPALYHYKRVEIKPFIIAPQRNSISIDNIINGSIPSSLFFFMIDNESYNGVLNKNPLEMSHNKIESFTLFVNGSPKTESIITDFDKSKIFSRAYSTIFNACGTLHTNNGNLITEKKFANGYFMLGFDLTNDSSASSVNFSSMSNVGNLRIEARFSSPLQKTITCLVYLQYDACLSITKDRLISIEY